MTKEPVTHRGAFSAYNPDRLFKAVAARLGLNNEGTLSRRLRLPRKLMEEMRRGRAPVTATILLMISEVSGMGIDELRRILGDRRARLRLGCRMLFEPGIATG